MPFRIFITLSFLFLSGILFAQECNIIYVTPNGATSGVAGTKTTPASLAYALTLANAPTNKIHMAAGTYIISQPLSLVSNTTIEGGFNSSWDKTNNSATTILRDNQNVQPNPLRLIGLTGNNINNFRLQDLTIRVLTTFDNSVSTYTVYLNGCSDYQLVRCKLIGGNAGNGTNGTNGVNGIGGTGGAAGLNGDEDGTCCTNGGAGGSGSFPGSNAGGTGGNGGQRGTYVFPTGGQAYNGSQGTPGQGLNAGGNGFGGIGIFTVILSLNCDRTVSSDGTNGIGGIDGLPGIAGGNGTSSFSGGFFVPGDGLPGNTGLNGGGGGGAGGGGSQGGLAHDILFGLPPNTNGSGAGGGGGGEGGQGGTGASGGTGGGGAFCLYLYNNGANGLIKDCQYTVGFPGFGGQGGQGGIGGTGGIGGAGGGQFNCDVGAGGDGGAGGKGGNGGAGGAGADGVSYAVYEDGGTPIQQYNINGLQQPIVQVNYSGCTGVPVEFFTTATGSVTWYFGAGASPATGVGTTGLCQFNTTGRKTFTMVNNGVAYTFTDYIDIFNNQANPIPSITVADDSLCEGETTTLASSIASDSYNWFVTGPNGYFDIVTGATNQTLPGYVFPTPGNYRFVLQTISNCCGPSFADTAFVNVEDILQPVVSIASSIDTICQNEIVVFTAEADSVGANPGYQWFVNSTPVGADAPAYSSSNIANGDVITCQVTSSLGCGTGLQATSNNVSVYVIAPPQLTCNADSFITGRPTYFDTEVTSGGLAPFDYIWDFGDNASGQGPNLSHIYAEPGPYSITVTVTDANGCSNTCTFVISVSSILAANYDLSATGGCPPLTVDFTNNSTNAVTYLWDFGDGSTSPQENPTHTYNSPGTYDVTLYAFGVSGNVSTSTPNQIAIYPTPTANFLAFPINVENGSDSIQFTDNSFDATTWLWDFGDPASGANNTSTLPAPIHWYAGNGTYNVTLIVTNTFGCTDTVSKNNLFGVNVGLNEQNQPVSGLQVYPNPTTGNLNLSFTLNEKGPLKIDLYSIDGRLAAPLFNTMQSNAGEYKLNYALPADLQTGLYLLRIVQNGKLGIAKVSVVR
jgi:PKD repeat protein